MSPHDIYLFISIGEDCLNSYSAKLMSIFFKATSQCSSWAKHSKPSFAILMQLWNYFGEKILNFTFENLIEDLLKRQVLENRVLKFWFLGSLFFGTSICQFFCEKISPYSQKSRLSGCNVFNFTKLLPRDSKAESVNFRHLFRNKTTCFFLKFITQQSLTWDFPINPIFLSAHSRPEYLHQWVLYNYFFFLKLLPPKLTKQNWEKYFLIKVFLWNCDLYLLTLYLLFFCI